MINIKDKTLRGVLFGKCDFNGELNLSDRSSYANFPASKDGERDRVYKYRTNDGFVLHLIEMIEKLEERIEVLESKKK